MTNLAKIFQQFEADLSVAKTSSDILNVKSRYLGRKGKLTEILKSLKQTSEEERKILGPQANELKSIINEAVDKKLKALEIDQINQELQKEKIDITLKESVMAFDPNHGGIHPVTKVQQEIEDIFLTMGFEILDGPHIENEFYNFEALNIPSDHPARDMQDTFWFQDKSHLLRTHTSTIQVRGMLERTPPFAFIAPGKVFRCERTDAGHEMVFHQLEGMMVGKDINISHLIYFMNILLERIFHKKVPTRPRPGFFPFVEPGIELDIECQVCRNKRPCSVCKNTGWLELLPCGMVHPNVLRAGGIDNKAYSGLAFGLGLDRLVMMRYGIDDIRYIHSGDLRFIQQFKDF